MASKREASGPDTVEERACFVIMPISDSEGYVKGHFKHVYQDIIQPACGQAGFVPVRADEVKQSNLIHLDILQRLLDAPMAVCDLSTRNPNVLFELALRQAFDKPVALIQEVGTATIFDISPLRYVEYRKERIYHEVIEDQRKVAEAISETFEAHRSGKGVNSIVKLLALSGPATIPEISSPQAGEGMLHLILSEVSQLRREVRLDRRDVAAQQARVIHRDMARVSNEITLLEAGVLEAERHLAAGNPEERARAELLLAECRVMSDHLRHLSVETGRVPAQSMDQFACLVERITMLESLLQHQALRNARSDRGSSA